MLDFAADSTTDNGDPYGDVIRQSVPSSASAADQVESVTPVSLQSAIPVITSKPDPPMAHPVPITAEHYKSPPSAGDGVSPPVVTKPKPELPPKSALVPAIPPRKPRPPPSNPAPTVPSRPEVSKAAQPQPPLPHFAPANHRKSTGNSFLNRTYGVSASESQPDSSKRFSVEANDSTPPVPVPRAVAAVDSVSSNPAASSSNVPLPHDARSAVEDVSQ